MAVRQFALKLDNNSLQTGDRTMKDLKEAGTPAKFLLSNVTSGGASDGLNLITKKNGTTTNHPFSIGFVGSGAEIQISAASLATVYSDAQGGEWDYVEVYWTVGQTETPSQSEFHMVQNGNTYDLAGWPPNQPDD